MINNTRITKLVWRSQVAAVAQLLAGGKLQLRAGPRSISVENEPPQDSAVLVELPFPEEFAFIDSNTFAFRKLIGVATTMGKVTHFRCISAKGEAVLDGSAGKGDADVPLEDAQIYPGMEITIDEFSHTLKGLNK